MKRTTVSVISLAISVLGTPAVAADDSGFYKNRTIEVVISYSPGGGYDTYGRLIAGHIVNHIPGRPSVVVKNMPGAGGVVGANYLYNVASRDGSVLGEINENAPLGQVLGTKGIKYDARKFTWIGRMVSNTSIFYTWNTSKAKTSDDLFKREVVAGGTGPTSNSVILPRVLNQLVGTHFKLITGYKSTADISLAMQNGEIDGGTKPWTVLKSSHADWLRNNTINLVVQFGLERQPGLPNVPTVIDLTKTKEQRQIFMLILTGGEMGRSLMAPPGVPANRAAILRAAFNAAMKDPKLVAQAKKTKLEIEPAPASKLMELVGSVFEAPPDVVQKTAKLVNSGRKKSSKKSKK